MKILVVAAHPDDEILGVGGTLLKHKAQGDKLFVCMVTRAYEPQWTKTYIQSKLEEAKKVDRILGIDKRVYCGFPTVRLNTIAQGEFNKKISEVIDQTNPDVVYTHFEHDLNKDHGIIFNAVMVATRPTITKRIKVLCFETLSSSEWDNKPFVPNYYVDISKFIDKKIDAFSQYKSEIMKYPHPRSKKGIRIWANKRGMEICKEYAEAFIMLRDVW